MIRNNTIATNLDQNFVMNMYHHTVTRSHKYDVTHMNKHTPIRQTRPDMEMLNLYQAAVNHIRTVAATKMKWPPVADQDLTSNNTT